MARTAERRRAVRATPAAGCHPPPRLRSAGPFLSRHDHRLAHRCLRADSVRRLRRFAGGSQIRRSGPAPPTAHCRA
eukprot:scaffold2775_cov343-Prasinococcus_capsulatus_cf.AAC.13